MSEFKVGDVVEHVGEGRREGERGKVHFSPCITVGYVRVLFEGDSTAKCYKPEELKRVDPPTREFKTGDLVRFIGGRGTAGPNVGDQGRVQGRVMDRDCRAPGYVRVRFSSLKRCILVEELELVAPTSLTFATTTARGSVLDEAKGLIEGDRNNSYGPPTQDFARTAGVLNALGYRGPDGRGLEPHDVAIVVAAVKLSRLMWTPEKRDNWVDLAGYAACGFECATEEGKLAQVKVSPEPGA